MPRRPTTPRVLGSLLLLVLLIQTSFPVRGEAQTLEEARRLNDEVLELHRQGEPGQARARAERALAIRRQLLGEDHPLVAESLNNLGQLHAALGDYAGAESYLKQALLIDERVFGPSHPNVATGLNNLAEVYRAAGDDARAFPLMQRALSIDEKALGPEDPHVAGDLNNLAAVHWALGRPAQARKLLERALAILEKTVDGNHPRLATCLANLAGIHESVAEYDEAVSLLKNALEIKEKSLGPAHPEVLALLESLAPLHRARGEWSEARSVYERLLEIRREREGEDGPSLAEILGKLGRLEELSGDRRKALEHFRRAREIREKALGEEHPDTAQSALDLADFYARMDLDALAAPLYQQALGSMEKAKGPEDPDLIPFLEGAARFRHGRGDLPEALPLYERAAAILEKRSGKGSTAKLHRLYRETAILHLDAGRVEDAEKLFHRLDDVSGLGRCHLERGDYSRALQAFVESRKENGEPGLAELVGLGRVAEGKEDLDEALERYSEAVDFIEARWETLSPFLRRDFLEQCVGPGFSVADPYEGMMRALYRRRPEGFAKKALEYAERLKSLLFLQNLRPRDSSGRDAAQEEELRDYWKSLEEIHRLRVRRAILRDLGEKDYRERLAQVEESLGKALKARKSLMDEIESRSPELAALASIRKVSVDDVLAALDENVTLVEYYVGADRSYVWLGKGDGLQMREIPLGEAPIAKMVNDLVRLNISDRAESPRSLRVLPSDAAALEAGTRQRQDNRELFFQHSLKLYQHILAPLRWELRTPKVVVVPHGPLFKVPFAALTDGSELLVERHAVGLLPSASVLPRLEARRTANLWRVLAMINPETEYGTVGYSEGELDRIQKLFPEHQAYSGKKATESLLREKGGAVDVIHLASHGEFSERQPRESGIFLAPDEVHDGHVSNADLFHLNLRNVNLVVLSASEARYGPVAGGEDLQLLAQGLLQAGCPSLLMTLWKLENPATSRLAQNFFENWHLEGMDKLEALRQAQLSIRSEERFQHPYFWGGIVFWGDWR